MSQRIPTLVLKHLLNFQTDFSYFHCLRHITLLRISFNESILHQLYKYIESSKGAATIERISLEFVLQVSLV